MFLFSANAEVTFNRAFLQRIENNQMYKFCDSSPIFVGSTV